MPGKEAYRRSMERAFAKETRLKAKAMKREQKRGKLSNGGEACFVLWAKARSCLLGHCRGSFDG